MTGRCAAMCGIECRNLFSEFSFCDLRRAHPPPSKGVYAIRVRQKGLPPATMLKRVRSVVTVLDWPVVGEKVIDRTSRILNIGDCPIIYIGSAGTQTGSKYTLKGRYGDFSGRHTAMFPLWVLLYYRWELEYGYFETDSPGALEKEIKQRYKEVHAGELPALVSI